MKLAERRMRRGLFCTFEEYHKIGVAGKQTGVTLTLSDKEDTTWRFTSKRRTLLLEARVSVTSSIIDGLKICPTANSVCLLTVNAKTTARIDAKCSRITKNDPESVLHGLKSLVLVLWGRYRDISAFPSQPTATKWHRPCATSLIIRR